jgi:ABC-type proline/glycine betaine transport system permease subunit
VRVFAAAILVALLAILTELGFGWVQRRAVSPGLASPSDNGLGIGPI